MRMIALDTPAAVPEGGALTVEQAAAFLGCTPGTLAVWTRQRRVPCVKVGSLNRYLADDLRAWLESRRRPAMVTR